MSQFIGVKQLWLSVAFNLSLHGLCVASASADVRDTFSFVDVPSRSGLGSPKNTMLNVEAGTGPPYVIGEIHWNGTASATPDPDDASIFPSWGADLSVQVTHLPTDTRVELTLGSGAEFGPGSMDFSGSSRALNGLAVSAGDEFTFEIFELLDDPVVDPDAIWNDITFELHHNFAPPLIPPAENSIRFDTIGTNTFPTDAGTAGAEFFGIQYGEGGGPAIDRIALNTAATGRDDVWFDSDEFGQGGGPSGLFQANQLEGVTAPAVSFETEDSDPQFAGDFAVMLLDFAPGDFGPGNLIRFGIDTDGGFDTFASGDAFALLDPPLRWTAIFEDGTLLVADSLDAREDVDHASFADVPLASRRLQADFDNDTNVDGRDLLTMLTNFGKQFGVSHATGDTDGNGLIDRRDFDVWQQQAGGVLNEPNTQPLPEPTSILVTVVLMGFAVVVAVGRNQRRKQHGVDRYA